MTEHQNTNANDEQPIPTPDGGRAAGKNHEQPDLGNLDEAWAAFEAAHQDDLIDVASSRQAKKFEKQAQRREKEALLHVNDLDLGTFTDDAVPLRERIRRSKRTNTTSSNGVGDKSQSGPRDFTGSSWLDTDDVMDEYGDDFVPPNPEIGHIPASKLVFWALLLVGVFGLIASAFLPALAGILGTVFGVCAILGGAGLIARHKGHTDTREDYFDEGARV